MNVSRVTFVIDAGYVLFVVLAVAVGAWMNSAQDAYMRAHARANGMEPQTSGTMLRRLLRPWALLRSAPLTAISRAVGTRQADPGLERLRQTVIARRWIASALIFGTFFAYSLMRMRGQ